jgi:hypothetical protein
MKRKTKGQAVVSDVGHPCEASKKSSNTDDKYIGGMVNREGLYLTWSMLSRRVTHKYSKYAIQKSEEECMTKYNGQVREASHIPTCFFFVFLFMAIRLFIGRAWLTNSPSKIFLKYNISVASK